MDIVRFSVASETSGIEIEINGQRLEEFARVAELPLASSDGEPDLAGMYAPFGASGLWPDIAPHFMGSPTASWFNDGDTVLIGCECGEWGCWPLTADIVINRSEVTWSHFRQGHRDWDLSGLGPFVFERAQYEAALLSATP